MTATPRDYATDPSPRILDAEARREFRALLDASSLGTPGAKALRKYGRIAMGSAEVMTMDELRVMDAEMRQLDEMMTGR